jgi:hypothetical protein
MASGIECFRVVFPYGADANDVAVGAKRPPASSAGPCRGTLDGGGHRERSSNTTSSRVRSFLSWLRRLPSPAAVTAPAVVAAHDELVIEAGAGAGGCATYPRPRRPGACG